MTSVHNHIQFIFVHLLICTHHIMYTYLLKNSRCRLSPKPYFLFGPSGSAAGITALQSSSASTPSSLYIHTGEYTYIKTYAHRYKNIDYTSIYSI